MSYKYENSACNRLLDSRWTLSSGHSGFGGQCNNGGNRNRRRGPLHSKQTLSASWSRSPSPFLAYVLWFQDSECAILWLGWAQIRRTKDGIFERQIGVSWSLNISNEGSLTTLGFVRKSDYACEVLSVHHNELPLQIFFCGGTFSCTVWSRNPFQHSQTKSKHLDSH